MCRFETNVSLATVAMLAMLAIGNTSALAIMPDDVPSAGANTARVRDRDNGSFTIRRVGENYSVEADHADVPGLLHALFQRADGQYTSDGTAVGRITLRLTNQSLTTVLHTICDQCFLRYSIANGIYRFQRDDEAVKAAFERLNILDAAFQDQLRRLGVNVPLALEHGSVGGFGRGLSVNGALSNPSPGALYSTIPPAPGAGGGAYPGSQNGLRSDQPAGGEKDNSGATRALGNVQQSRGFNQPQGGYGALRMRSGNAQVLQELMTNQFGYYQPQFRAFLSDNRLVTLQVPQTQPIPVADAFAVLGRQANTPILIDPAVPSGLKFRMWGTISPRPLAEAMNTLAGYARLQWRWVGNSIFVTSPPELQLYYGDALIPRASYPSAQPGYPGVNTAPGAAAPAAGAAGFSGAAGPSGPVGGNAPPVPQKAPNK